MNKISYHICMNIKAYHDILIFADSFDVSKHEDGSVYNLYAVINNQTVALIDLKTTKLVHTRTFDLENKKIICFELEKR